MHQSKIADWERLRADFPILEQNVNGHPLIYFDNAATTQKPRAVIEALRHYYENDNANVHRGLHELSSRATEAYEKARERVAAFIGAASANEIVFTRGTSESINLVAQAWGGKFLRRDDVICSPKWSTTAISCRGNYWRSVRGRACVSCRCARTAPWTSSRFLRS